MDTLAVSLTDVEVKKVGETVAPRNAEPLISKLANGLKEGGWFDS